MQKTRGPSSEEAAAKLSERYLAACRDAQCSFGDRSQRGSSKSGGEGDHDQCKVSFAGKQGDGTNKQEVRCNYCGALGHTKPFCLSRKVKHSALSYVPCPHPPYTLSHESLQTHTTEILMQVLVNGQSTKALVDTGSTRTIVHDRLVLEDEYITQNFSKGWCVH